MKNKRIAAYILLLVVSIIWGIASPVIKHTLDYFTPTIFLTYRFFLSTVVALFYFSLRPGTIPHTRFQVTHTLTHSIGIVILGLGLLFFGFNYTDALTGNLLAATGPVFSIILGYLLLHEHVSRHEMIGLLLAVLGSIFIVFTGDGAKTLGLFGVAMMGNAAILIAGIAGAFGGVATKKALNHGMNPHAITHAGFIIGFLCFALLALFQTGGIAPILTTIISAPLGAHLGVAYMALISGTLGYILSTKALESVELGESSIFSYLTVLWGTPISVLWLGEKFTPQFLIGAAIIATGVTIAEWKRRKKQSKRKAVRKR